MNVELIFLFYFKIDWHNRKGVGRYMLYICDCVNIPILFVQPERQQGLNNYIYIYIYN